MPVFMRVSTSAYLLIVSRARGCDADGHSRRAAAGVGRCLRTSLFEPEGAFGVLNPVEQNTLKREAAKLAEVF